MSLCHSHPFTIIHRTFSIFHNISVYHSEWLKEAWECHCHIQASHLPTRGHSVAKNARGVQHEHGPESCVLKHLIGSRTSIQTNLHLHQAGPKASPPLNAMMLANQEKLSLPQPHSFHFQYTISTAWYGCRLFASYCISNVVVTNSSKSSCVLTARSISLSTLIAWEKDSLPHNAGICRNDSMHGAQQWNHEHDFWNMMYTTNLQYVCELLGGKKTW